MLRFATLALAAAPLALSLGAPSVAVAQSSSGLSQVTSHLKAVDTMTADFAQTDKPLPRNQV